MNEFAEKIYSLKVGERFLPSSMESWTRVPGGWVYGDMQGTVFIPFDNEFQPKNPGMPL
jgi:hypothetical protein